METKPAIEREEVSILEMSVMILILLTLRHLKTVFSSQPSDDKSSSDETSHQPKMEPSKELCECQFSSGLNKCVILALVIATGVGFGHFYVRKICEDESNDRKDSLSLCQQEQEYFIDYKEAVLNIFLEREEKALSSLQEELRKLREQIRILEDKGTGTELLTENQKLKQHLEEEKLKTHESCCNPDSPNVVTEKKKKEIEILRERLTELEQKLKLKQQHSDLWKSLYSEAKDQNKIFDAMKNSTKEFVRHHKEKINQAKEASQRDTKNIFDEEGNQRFGATKVEAARKPTTVFSEYLHPHAVYGCSENYDSFRMSCSGIFECDQQESNNLFNMKALNAVRVDEFRQLIKKHLLEKIDSFPHWRELNTSINMKEYQVDNDGVFEKLDGYTYMDISLVTLFPLHMDLVNQIKSNVW
ncbi:unnamed protein product [Nyctereutes procyonoides]|uniref:(raccoon dog) hypothetical protein n=1 Tax=Nyctereutes procyonoides TaxID=34880 RepID=A0A811YUE3_NYCPR|nr:unnamed protein product [Nyctereutes procyonoides]